MIRARLLAAMLVAATAAGCGAGDESESVGVRDDALAGGLLRRVVIARAYQRHGWTLPDVPAVGASPAIVRDAKYVCDVLASFEPTLVSGLIRYAGKHRNDKGEVEPRDEVTQDEKAFFHGVRSCIQSDHGLADVRFDVVLNATYYETRTEVVNHLRHIDEALHPDGFYFDFFQRGYAEHPAAIEGAIEWIQERGKFVGGTVWGHQAPPHVDYVALDDFEDVDPEGGTHTGWERMTREAAALHQSRPGLPLLFHIENNPTGKTNNHGEDWIRWGSSQRIELLEKHAEKQKKVGYRYMYPVFFPLSRNREGALAAFAGIGSDRVLAYDVNLDGPVRDKTHALMAEFNPLPGQ